MLLLLLAACDLTKFGAYTCDEYCGQVMDKTEECATQAAEEECAQAAGDSVCGELTEEQLSEYASQGRDDWAGKTRKDMLESCNADLESSGKADSACQAETATINNLTCDQILDLLGQIAEEAG